MIVLTFLVPLVLAAPPTAGPKPAPVVAPAPGPEKLRLVERELEASRLGDDGVPIRKRVRVLGPDGWTGDDELDSGSIRLLGPEGQGEIYIAAVLHPEALGEHLTRLKNGHPAASPSPPRAMEVKGINPERGERATRFVISGREVGEMVMIERGGAIVLFATIVEPSAWPALEPVLARCYPAVRVTDVAAPRREKVRVR